MYASVLPRESRSCEICVKIKENLKNIPNIIDRAVNKNSQISIIFNRNSSDTTGYQINVLVSISPNVCFCTTWGKQSNHIKVLK